MNDMDRQVNLKKFAVLMKMRRAALKLTMRELAEISGISPALIAKLENASMRNFPKRLTIEQLSRALKYDNELFELAGIVPETAPAVEKKDYRDNLRELLAVDVNLSPENVELAIYFIDGLKKLEEMKALEN